ncbi:hypothetical protein KP509_22G019000 [Ceratopteris richardii]|uniref:Uncharacterized protein n=1 Tax=Ceratopteris richardii TaxID=49495 RepID=A0A8T2S419_CERRI|nr:hypothetical protein KP509_22G019000 [Ceratopteris richardii]
MALRAASLLIVLVAVVAAAAVTARDQHQQASTLGEYTSLRIFVFTWSINCDFSRQLNYGCRPRNGRMDRPQTGSWRCQPEPYAYGQWVAFQLSYTGEGSLYIRNASLPWGKWYDYPDKDREVAAPNGQAIAPGSILYVAACGRENSPSGTEGTFEIWSSTSKVAHVYFDCPWSGSNKLEINRFSTQYLLDFNTAPSSGPIGIIPFAIYQK